LSHVDLYYLFSLGCTHPLHVGAGVFEGVKGTMR
jgi:hypothetical protein